MEWIVKLGFILQQEWLHWLTSAISGLLAWLLTLIIYSIASRQSLGSVLSRDTRPKRYIILLALSLGLLAVWFVHTRLDLFTVWYTTPLGPHLIIK